MTSAPFSWIAEAHRPQLFRICMRILRDRQAAEDCVQTSLAKAFEHLDQFRADAPLPAWLNQIAANAALAHLRKQKPGCRRQVSIEAGAEGGLTPAFLADPHPDPEHTCYSGELRILLRQAVEELPPRFRSVVVLRAFEGLSTEDVARTLNISAQAVKSRMCRAHTHMRHTLRKARPRRGPAL